MPPKRAQGFAEILLPKKPTTAKPLTKKQQILQRLGITKEAGENSLLSNLTAPPRREHRDTTPGIQVPVANVVHQADLL